MLRQSFWLPFRHFGSVLYIFFPFIILFISTVIVTKIIHFNRLIPPWSPNAEYYFYAKSLFSLYLFVLLCRGLALWHRKIITGETPNYLPFFFSDRDLKYAFYGLGIAFLIVVATFISSYAPSYIFYKGSFAYYVKDLSYIGLLTVKLIVLWDLITVTCAGIFIAFFLNKTVLLLPAISLGDKLPELREKVLPEHKVHYSWQKNLFICASLISIILLLKSPDSDYKADMIAVIIIESMAGLFAVLATLVFATLLSLYYRDNILPEYQSVTSEEDKNIHRDK